MSLRQLGRATAIALTAALGAAWYLGGLLLVYDAPEIEEKKIAALRGRVLRWVFERLGATFVKLGQVMSTRRDLFAGELIEELRALQDALAAFSAEEAIASIEATTGRPLKEGFRRFEREPIAAASVAQVHEAELLDGSRVAIKVLRPGVRERAQEDASILLAFARLERLHPAAEHARVFEHLWHFMEGVIEQTDLRNEASNYRKFKENFRSTERVRFPHVHEELSGERVLVMEFVEGKKVDEIDVADYPDLPRRLREVFLKMCFEDGLLHADLHPGNLRVGEGGEIILFDVGLVKELSEEALLQYIDFNRCLAMGTVEDFMRHIRAYHTYVEGTVDWQAFEEDIARLNAMFRSASAQDIEMSELTQHVFEAGRRHGVRPVPEIALMIVGVVTAEGIGKQLAPEVNSLGEVASFLMPILARRGMLQAAMPLAGALMDRAAPPPRPSRR